MSDIPAEGLRFIASAVRRGANPPGVPALLDEAAAELTRLRGGLAAALEERDKLAKEVALLREAMSRESDGAQYLASLLVEAEAALLSVSQQRGKADSERNAAQEREQRMREALTTARGFYQVTHIHAAIDAALSAIRGEP